MKGVNFIHYIYGENIYEFRLKDGWVDVLDINYTHLEAHELNKLEELPETNQHRDLLMELYKKHQ